MKRTFFSISIGALLLAALPSIARAQSTAGFPTEPPPGGAPPRPAPPPAPPPSYPAPAPYAPPPQAPPPSYPAPAPYVPPQQYPPQAPPGYAPYPAPQQYPQRYPPQQYPQQYPPQPGGYPAPAPGYPPPQYPGWSPYPAQAPPPNAIADSDLRYRTHLGAYQRPDAGADAGAQSRAAFVRVGPRTRRRHDGFYFRFGGGLGQGHDSVDSGEPLPSVRPLDFDSGRLHGSGGGFAAATEIAVGFTPGAGVAIGAGVYTATIPGLSARVGDTRLGTYEYKSSQFALFGPFADWYFDRDGGFHAQASPGVATYVVGAAEPTLSGAQAQAHTGVGFGFMLGLGYDVWVSEQWSLGLLGRFLWGSTSGTDNRKVDWEHTTYSPALLLTLTYN